VKEKKEGKKGRRKEGRKEGKKEIKKDRMEKGGKNCEEK